MQIFQRGFNFGQDGPGNRLVYHLQGCNMRCIWCSNPEGMKHDGGKEVSITEIFDECTRSKAMFFSGGGVTFTGGEATMQHKELLELLKLLKSENVHTCIETNGTSEKLSKLLEFIDYLIMDFKHYDSNTLKKYTGIGNETIEKNFEENCKNGREQHIRIPLINGINTENPEGFAEYFSKFDTSNTVFEFLTYHEYGKDKWTEEYKVKNGFVMLSHCKQRFVRQYRLSPEFVLSVVGKTGTFKTQTSIALFNSYDGSIASFEDTLASIRRVFQSSKSGVTIVDDFKSNTKENNAKYEKMVRLCGDAQTTGKYVVGNKVVDELITGMTVITGEKRPHLQQSSYSRILFVDVGQFPISQNYLTELQKSKADINSFIVLFTQYIIQNNDFNKNCISLFQKYRDDLLQNDNYKGMHGRYYGIYGWLAAMWDMYVGFLHKYGVCVEFDFKTEIKTYIYSQHCRYDNNPVKLFKLGYLELLNSNEFVVIDNNSVEGLNFDVIQYDDKLFLKSNSVYKKICKLWNDRGIDFSCGERKLRQHLYEAGILEVRNGKYTVEKKTKDNRSYSGYYLRKNFL